MSSRLYRTFVVAIALGALIPAAANARRSATRTGRDTAYWAVGDHGGYRLFAATSSSGWRWRALATIQPRAEDSDEWIGYHCVTGDGRSVVAVVAPRHAANDPVARDRGADAYAVDTRSGRVRLVATGVALKYYNPGCGTGRTVVLTRHLGVDQARTQLVTVDARTGRTVAQHSVDGQVTSAVPGAGGPVGAVGNAIVRVARSGISRLARVPGQPYALHPSRRGLDFLVAARDRAAVWQLRQRRASRAGAGSLRDLALFAGAGGRNTVVNARRVRRGTGLRRAIYSAKGPARSASLHGRVILGDPASPRTAANRFARLAPRVASAKGRVQADRSLGRPTRAPFTASGRGSGRARGDVHAAANTTTPKCAVPRNSLTRQVPQPNAAQVNWAIQQAVRNNLRGGVLTRPSNYANMGLASYQPSNDFSAPSLHGYPGTAVPPSVVQAIYAQESNWRQASWHALPGLSGNPLVADYYGDAGTLTHIDYDQADCGYGISQLTDPMTASATALSANGKAKVAVDYAENVAAGLQVLGDKWNQLYDAGITANGGNPNYLENWYFAVWAYNTGFHPAGSGPWGLGWTNNPQNADYPPNRSAFLRVTYADAEHPADWPYQERVIGFMESPLLDYKGKRSYATPTPQWTVLPGNSRFCDASNECSPSYHNATNPSLDYCMRADRQCWWHQPATWTNCGTGGCAQSSYTYSTSAAAPAGDDNYPPACNSVLPSNAIIVDDETTNINVEGCGGNNWTSQGDFSISHGRDASGAAVGVIDWHQLGTGLGGHTYFTHNRVPGDTMHIETGTWTPPTLPRAVYNIEVHIPVNGATSQWATYRVERGDGTSDLKTVNQHIGQNRWVSLGDYTLGAGAKVVLDNTSTEVSGAKDIAYDAVAFIKVGAAPSASDTQLAGTFKPVLRFDSSEKWRPLNLSTFFQETVANAPLHRRCMPLSSPDATRELGYEHSSTTPDADDFTESYIADPNQPPVTRPVAHCPGVTDVSQVPGYVSQDAYLDLQGFGTSGDVSTYKSPDSRCHVGILLECNGDEIAADPKSSVYWHVSHTSGYTYVQYWLFYRYNSYGDNTGIGQHEGDWEAVAVAPSPTDSSAFDYASFAQHGHWYSYLRSAMQCSGGAAPACGAGGATHLHTFVANGSHASYPNACSEVVANVTCYRGDGSTPERGYDGTRQWGHNSDGAGMSPMPPPNSGTWTDWAGHWGATDSGRGSPQSPAAQGMFARPWENCANGAPTCAHPRRIGGGLQRAMPATLARAQSACETWFGGGVAALLCDERELADSLGARALGAGGGVRATVVRRRRARGGATRSDGARGVTQVVGSALRSGDRVVLRGRIRPGMTLRLRISAGRRVVKRTVTMPGATRAIASVSGGGNPRVRVRSR